MLNIASFISVSTIKEVLTMFIAIAIPIAVITFTMKLVDAIVYVLDYKYKEIDRIHPGVKLIIGIIDIIIIICLYKYIFNIDSFAHLGQTTNPQ